MGRKGVVTLITEEGKSFPAWLVVNPQVFSVFDNSNHLRIIRLFRLSNIEVIDLFDSACFQIKNKRKTNRENPKNSIINKQHGLYNIFNRNKLTFNPNSLLFDERENLASLHFSKIEDFLRSNESYKSFFKVPNDIYCLINKQEKDVWINSIKNHMFT